MAKGSTFTCVEMDSDNGLNELNELCSLNTDIGNKGPVTAIGNGYFRIGSQIFKFGVADAVCKLPMDIEEPGVTRLIQGADSVIIHASACIPDYARDEDYVYEGSVVIRHFNLDGTQVLKLTCQLANEDMISNMVFWKNHIVVSTCEGPWSVIDCMTGNVTHSYKPVAHEHGNMSFSLKVIDHGRQLAVFYGETREYYDESQECDEIDCEPVVRLLATLDIVDGKLVETGRPNNSDAVCSLVVEKAFNIKGRYRRGFSSTRFVCMPDILHMNRTMFPMMKCVNTSVLGYNFIPTENDEVLVYMPTCTVLPIRGSDKHKDITIIDSMVSADGNFMVMLVTAQDGFDTRLQICALNLRTGNAENATVARFGHYDHQVTAKLHGFVYENKAVMYSRTNADDIDSLVKQPIFNGVLDCKADELFRKFGATLPLEIVRHIVSFM